MFAPSPSLSSDPPGSPDPPPGDAAHPRQKEPGRRVPTREAEAAPGRLAYWIPVLLNLRNRVRGKGEFATPRNAAWSPGRFAPLLNAIAVLWVGFIAVVFCLPPNELVLWTMALVCLGLAGYWLISARRTFHGPVGG